MSSLRTITLTLAATAAFASVGTAARADDPPTIPTGTVKETTATKGSTDVAKGGFVGAAPLPSADDPRHATEAALSAGGLFSSGNARTVAITSGGKFRHRDDEHQFTAAAAINFARAGKKGEPTDTTVENYQALIRYDYFLTDNVSLFLQSSARRDRFQGLDLRLNVDPGIAYYFINTKKQVLRAEVGYDLQHDIRRDEDLVVAPAATAPAGTPPTTLEKSKTLHNARAFVGYENKLYEQVSFVSSLEYLQNFEDTETYRLIFDAGLKSNIGGKFAIATTYTMRYENAPLPKVEKSDSIASVNLVYTLF